MHLLRRALALVLVALWVPATLHCDFEAAGLEDWFGCNEEAAPKAAQCADDVCQPLDGFAYKSDAAAVKILPPAPDLWSDWLISLAPSFATLTSQPGVPLRESPPAVRPWQFARRAAPPARAPDFGA